MKLTNLFNLKRRHRREPSANKFVLELLEPRLMLSATPAMPAVVPHDHLGHAHTEGAVISILSTMGDGGSDHSHQKPGANGWEDDCTVTRGISTTTTLISSAVTSVYRDAVTFTARVTSVVGAARPAGSVEFFDGTRSLGIDDTASRGSRSTAIFTISVSNLTAGTHAIHAVFTGGTGQEPGQAGSERHDRHEHRARPRERDAHRHDGGLQESHQRGHHESHHHGHAHHELLKHHFYNNSTSGNLEQTVSQKSLTASFTAASKTYDGTTTATVLTQTLAGVIASDDVSLIGGAATFADANVGTGKTVTLTGATLTGAASTNYSLTSVNPTTANINKANATLVLTGYYGTYDGAAHQATGTATGVNGESLAGLDLSSTSHTNAGVYIDTVTFTDVTGNYKDTIKNVKSTINKANAVITVTGYSVTFDGTAHTATGTVTGIDGEDLSAGLDLSSTTHTNVGTYLDVVTFMDVTGNYKNTLKNVSSRIR